MLKKFIRKLHMKSFVRVCMDLVAVILIWRAVWWFADEVFGSSLIGNIFSGVAGLLILFLDDFSLKELE